MDRGGVEGTETRNSDNCGDIAVLIELMNVQWTSWMGESGEEFCLFDSLPILYQSLT